MGVFGKMYLDVNPNITHEPRLEHAGTVQDTVMNYLLGTLLVIMFPVGVFCNVLVFR